MSSCLDVNAIPLIASHSARSFSMRASKRSISRWLSAMACSLDRMAELRESISPAILLRSARAESIFSATPARSLFCISNSSASNSRSAFCFSATSPPDSMRERSCIFSCRALPSALISFSMTALLMPVTTGSPWVTSSMRTGILLISRLSSVLRAAITLR